MKFYLFLALLITSLGALPQTKTGSGGVIPPTIGSSNAEDKLFSFLAVLHLAETKCRSNGHYYLKMSELDFMQTYLKLSVLSISFVPDRICENSSTYMSCLSNPEVKRQLGSILEDKNMTSHLMKKYSIKKEEAEAMLHSYESLFIKGCEKCQ